MGGSIHGDTPRAGWFHGKSQIAKIDVPGFVTPHFRKPPLVIGLS